MCWELKTYEKDYHCYETRNLQEADEFQAVIILRFQTDGDNIILLNGYV